MVAVSEYCVFCVNSTMVQDKAMEQEGILNIATGYKEKIYLGIFSSTVANSLIIMDLRLYYAWDIYLKRGLVWRSFIMGFNDMILLRPVLKYVISLASNNNTGTAGCGTIVKAQDMVLCGVW